MTLQSLEFAPHWKVLQPVLTIRNDRDYRRAITTLNALLDEIGTNEKHPLYSLLDALGTLIAAYEEANVVMPKSGPGELLRYLMDEHGLTQATLPEVGSQGVVSEVLNGKRDLNVRQIRALASRFGVSPAVFF